MANRKDYYFRQRVTEAELDVGFADLEDAAHNLAADLGFVGVLANAVVSQHAPVPDLTVDVSGPGSILDQLGQRIFFSALQNVNVAQDDNGVSTAVATAGNEKVVSVFAKFDRALSDAYGDSTRILEYQWREELDKRFSFWPVLTGSSMLWSLIVGILLVAYVRRRRKAKETLARWEQEEAEEDMLRARIVEAAQDDGTYVARATIPAVQHDGEWHTLH